jgi:hypothetical protein
VYKTEIDAAIKLIRETGWCRFAFARNARSQIVNCLSEDATCFCVSGALIRLYGKLKQQEITAAFGDWHEEDSRIADVNDEALCLEDVVKQLEAFANVES